MRISITPTPISPYGSSLKTTNGTLYTYSGADAALAVAAAGAWFELLQARQHQNDALSMMKTVQRTKADEDIVITSSVAGGIATALRLGLAAAGTVTGVTSAGTGIASLALSDSEKGAGVFEIIIHNNIAAPVNNYRFANGNCSTVSGVNPISSGTAASFEVVQPDGFEGGKTNIALYVDTGYGVVLQENSEDILTLDPVKCRVRYDFDNGRNWVPTYSVDESTYQKDNGQEGMTAVYFAPDEGGNMLGFRVAFSLVQKSTGAVDLYFLPEGSPSDL